VSPPASLNHGVCISPTLKLVQEFQNRVGSLGGGVREVNIPEFLSPMVLNALGLAAFNYDFRDVFREDGEDREEFAASLRDFMYYANYSQPVSRIMTSDLGPKASDSRPTGKCSVKVSWSTSPHGFWIR
jgi:hypothetical protein